MASETPEGAAAPPTVNPRLLLVSQLIFNAGFYMVLPFLATHLRDNLALAGAAVGLVLGVRTFSQQGLFVFGGALSDALGPRRIILLGCVVRTVGFLVLGFADSLVPVLIGACLTGVGGALFSPAVSALVALAGSASEARGGPSRSQLFARLAVWSECGAVLGPLLGALLLGVSFQMVSLAGTLVFVVMFGVFYRALPKGIATTQRADRDRERTVWWRPLGDKRFLAFIAVYSTGLLSYNQLYLALPVEIERAGAEPGALAVMFMVVSALVIALQLPINRLTRRLGAAISLPLGFLIDALGFAVVALVAPAAPAGGWWGLAPALVLVSAIAVARMVVNPVAMDLVPAFAGDSPLGVYYGALASAGGVAVLLGNALVGDLLDAALIPSPAAALPWWTLAILPAVSALAFVALLRFSSLGELTRPAARVEAS
ncbi:MFS transporter [Salinicola halophilus]|uniref:MFS transporter n=1 Tax=Salinicola halophilus TaxID=184065 RepID=UPI000DA1DAC3|nr:MFS transporter [Salinicola halophilus]